MAQTTLQQLAEHTGGRVRGDGNTIITSAATLEQAQPGQISFLNNNRYLPLLQATRASASLSARKWTPSPAAHSRRRYTFMQVVVSSTYRPHMPVGQPAGQYRR